MNILLPFAVRSEDRVKIFSKNMGDATVFCLAEIGRNKGGLIRKKPPEEIVFITEACYPVWRVPWGKVSLLFDGLGLRKHTVSFDILPDMKIFMKEVRANAGKTETYLDFLSHNVNYFQSFAGKGKKVVNGLIADPSFLKDFESYLSKARRVKGSMPDKVLLAPFIDETSVKASVDGLSDLRSDLEKDLKKLDGIVKMLIRLTDKHIKLLMNKNEELLQKAEKEIACFRSEAFKKTEGMRKKYDENILKVSKNVERNIQKLQEECEELEKHKAPLTVYAERCKSEISNCEARKEDAGVRRWKEEIQKCKGQISEIDKNVSEIKADIDEVAHSRDVEVSQIEAEFDAKSKTLMAGLKKAEDARDAKIASNEERIKALKESTSTLIAQMNKLSDLRRSAIADLDKIGLPQVRRKNVLVYIPFFLACYMQKFKRRYVLFPPSFVHGMRRVTKIKGVFKASKVTVILKERSRSITKFLNLLLQLIKQSPMFEEKMVKAGAKVNIVRTEETRKNIAKGLGRLRDEGWLSEVEFRSFKDQLSKS
jgi:hypothetical protein